MVSPSLLGVVPLGSVVGTVAAAASALAAILVLTAEVTSEVTLVAPPPPVAVEEAREAELSISSSGGPPSSSLPSGPKAPEESVAVTELRRPVASHANEVVEIPSDDEADTMVEPLVSPRELAVSPRELAVV